MNITITINTDNDAFVDNPGELPGILRKLADRAEAYGGDLWDGAILTDSCGNSVGEVSTDD